MGKERKIVNRDDRGNVVELGVQTDYDGSGWEEEMCIYTVEYDSDGNAKAILDFEGMPSASLRYENMEWENTDGQILFANFSIFSSELYTGANRIKKADIKGHNYGDLTMNVTYHGEDFAMESRHGETICMELRHEESPTRIEHYRLDENTSNGYRITTLIETDYDRWMLPVSSVSQSTYLADSNCEESKSMNMERYTIAYDTETGLPIESIQENSQNGEEYAPYAKVVYTNNQPADSEPDAIEMVAAESGNSPVERFDMSGRCVSNPCDGLYIRRQGTEAKKVLVRNL